VRNKSDFIVIAFAYTNLIKDCNNIKLDIELSNIQFDKSILNKR